LNYAKIFNSNLKEKPKSKLNKDIKNIKSYSKVYTDNNSRIL